MATHKYEKMHLTKGGTTSYVKTASGTSVSQEASGGRNGRTAWLRGLARPAALAGVVAAGLCTGYLAGRLVANEGPRSYCLYFVAANIPPNCTALHNCEFGHGDAYYAVPDYNGGSCNTHNVTVCGLTLQFDAKSSTTCPSP